MAGITYNNSVTIGKFPRKRRNGFLITEEEVGVIDILVNNAGIIKRIPMCDMTAEEFRQVIDVDLNAPFIVAKAVIPSMIKKGHGKIINICSMMSEQCEVLIIRKRCYGMERE